MSVPVPRLMAITGPAASLGPELDAWLDRLAGAGVDAVQVRRKELPDRDLLALVTRVRSALPPAVAVLVNGRVDVAVAGGADGVHLPAAGLPTRQVRRLTERLGTDLLVGRSTHGPEEVSREREEGADYVTFGPVYATPGKAPYGDPPGLAGLRRAAAAGIPVVALGGVDGDRLAEVAAAGAAGAAGIRVFQDAVALGRLVAAAGRVLVPPGVVVDSGPPS